MYNEEDKKKKKGKTAVGKKLYSATVKKAVKDTATDKKVPIRTTYGSVKLPGQRFKTKELMMAAIKEAEAKKAYKYEPIVEERSGKIAYSAEQHRRLEKEGRNAQERSRGDGTTRDSEHGWRYDDYFKKNTAQSIKRLASNRKKRSK